MTALFEQRWGSEAQVGQAKTGEEHAAEVPDLLSRATGGATVIAWVSLGFTMV